ncbi:hypothetical protein R3P38DRAFT_3200615 [Favolaschia claudopus]|uniref:CxC2-like cysteine cluster KDZ transposase-associated domain-containing protein n=1 Tax=Favolaschia claudopus TaxID=2862362 RepID=A0AAW0AXB7_9AGAR
MNNLMDEQLTNEETDIMIASINAVLSLPSWQTHTDTACTCGEPALYRCDDCALPELCQDCIVKAHLGQDFHVLELDEITDDTPDCDCGCMAEYRCDDCTVRHRCHDCAQGTHQDLPFHHVRRWSAELSYYTATTLRDAGLRVPLGHEGDRCPTPRGETLEALTGRGVETVAVDFCGCVGGSGRADQIRSYGWLAMRSNYVLALPASTIFNMYTS